MKTIPKVEDKKPKKEKHFRFNGKKNTDGGKTLLQEGTEIPNVVKEDSGDEEEYNDARSQDENPQDE